MHSVVCAVRCWCLSERQWVMTCTTAHHQSVIEMLASCYVKLHYITYLLFIYIYSQWYVWKYAYIHTVHVWYAVVSL